MSEAITNEFQDEEIVDIVGDEYEEDISVEQLLMHVLDKANLEEVEFDKKEFQKGLKDISYVCGMVTGLMNIGIRAVDGLTFVTNEHTFKNSVEINKLVNEAEIAKAKFQQLQIEKQTV